MGKLSLADPRPLALMSIQRTCRCLTKSPLLRQLVPVSNSWLYTSFARRGYVAPLNPLPVDTEPADEQNSPPRRGKIWETITTTATTLICLGIAGYGYHKYYKWLTLKKIEKTFEPGDPALELIPKVISAHEDHGEEEAHWVTRFSMYCDER